MRFVGLNSADAVREVIRTIRKMGAIPDGDGYYHFDITPEDFESLRIDPVVVEARRYMPPQAWAPYDNGTGILGLYGAAIGIWVPVK